MSTEEQHKDCTNRFIALANELSNAGNSVNLVNAALMAASAIYATYAGAGNKGGLEPSGVDKVVAAYRRNVEFVQSTKKAELRPS